MCPTWFIDSSPQCWTSEPPKVPLMLSPLHKRPIHSEHLIMPMGWPCHTSTHSQVDQQVDIHRPFTTAPSSSSGTRGQRCPKPIMLRPIRPPGPPRRKSMKQQCGPCGEIPSLTTSTVPQIGWLFTAYVSGCASGLDPSPQEGSCSMRKAMSQIIRIFQSLGVVKSKHVKQANSAGAGGQSPSTRRASQYRHTALILAYP